MFGFVPLATEHIPMLHRWLNDGLVLEWYARRPRSYMEIACSYGRCISGATKTQCFLIRIDDTSAGMIQCYRLADYPEYEHACQAEPGWWGIDYFLAEFRGKRLAAPMIDAFLCLHVHGPVIAGPHPENERSIRTLLRAGFVDHVIADAHGDTERILLRK